MQTMLNQETTGQCQWGPVHRNHSFDI